MLFAAFPYRIPTAGRKPEGWEAPNDEDHGSLISAKNVEIDQALKTSQFYQLWVVLCLNVTTGIGVLGVTQTMITAIFGSAQPQVAETHSLPLI